MKSGLRQTVKGSLLTGNLQLSTTDASTFLYNATNFGLINQTYPNLPPVGGSDPPTQWQQFAQEVKRLQDQCEPGTDYKVLFMGRHGEGEHNAAEAYYGTPAWNVCLPSSSLPSHLLLTPLVLLVAHRRQWYCGLV